jgi:PTH1 family peptidyl-tRNA hydrolase
MNLSGGAVVELTRERDIGAKELLVFVDDMALPVGTLRLRERGGDGGHRGLASVLEALGEEEVPRVRLGIAPPVRDDEEDEQDATDLTEFVLEPFSAEEREIVDKLLLRAVEATRTLLRDGMARAMSLYNRAPED